MKKHLPAIDGLRGLTALMVLLHHVIFPMSGAQFLGVDTFFVLSGYFSTLVITRGFDRSGTVDIKAFWSKRARRILPAMLLMLIVCFLVVVCTGTGGMIYSAARESLSILTFSSNWRLMGPHAFQLGYLGHTWSMSITEQYYLLWPVVLLALLKRTTDRRTLAFGMVVAAIAIWVVRISMISAGYASLSLGHEIYFAVASATPTRMDGLLVGSAVGILMASDIKLAVPKWLGSASAAVFAIIAIVIPMGLPEAWGTAVSEHFALLIPMVEAAVAGMLLGLQGNSGSSLHRLLSTRVLLWLGTRSYSFYLWHIPIRFALMFRYPEFRDPPSMMAAGHALQFAVLASLVVILSAAIAYLSYRFLEQPIVESGWVLGVSTGLRHVVKVSARKIGVLVSVPSFLS